jgi:hypothetical protein
MAASAPLFATVIHVATGHVLAAVSSGGLEPTLEGLTAGDHLRVRFPGKSSFVNVPISVLTAARVTVTADALDRSQYYVLGTGNTSLTFGAPPLFNAKLEAAEQAEAKDKQAIVVWQVGGDSIVATGPMGAEGKLPGTVPPGATHQLLAYVGGPLHLDELGQTG